MSESFPYDQLPISTVPDLTDKIERTTELIGRGGYGSVYKGRWLGTAVAIKILELVPLRDEAQRTKRFKQITRELSLWCSTQHKNILPLMGIARMNDDTNIPAFVCPWMENGNAKDFCSRNPRFPPMLILYDIINGLHYLHTFQPEIVHGDIKAVNVLINNHCEASLCDFGLSRFLIDNTLWKTTATHAVGTVRWMAPELLNGDASRPTKESDIYAYAMTCYEILSGDIPFKSVSNDMAIPIKVSKCQRPNRIETYHSNFMWDIITQCWEQVPEDRLQTETVLELLRQKIDWKEAEETLREKDAALVKVEKEIADLKEQMAKTEKDLKEEKEKALEDVISEKEREVNSLNMSLQQLETALELLENQMDELEREKDDIEDKYERQVVESQALTEQLDDSVAMHHEAAEEHEQAMGRAMDDINLLEDELEDLQHMNSSLREEAERFRHEAQVREVEADVVQQKQETEIAMLHKEAARALAEVEKMKVYVRTKYNLDEEALKTSMAQFEDARKFNVDIIKESIARQGGMAVALENVKRAQRSGLF